MFITFCTDEGANKEEYSLPANLQYGVEFGAFEYMNVNLTPENYRDRLHNLLFVEEYERRKRMTKYTVYHSIYRKLETNPIHLKLECAFVTDS